MEMSLLAREIEMLDVGARITSKGSAGGSKCLASLRRSLARAREIQRSLNARSTVVAEIC